jgi:acetate kinase
LAVVIEADATILTLNPGSSSLKVAVFSPDPALAISIDRLGTAQGSLTITSSTGVVDQREFSGAVGDAIDAVADELHRRGLTAQAVAHRVVQGGPKHHRPTLIDEQLLADLRDAIPLAPLHLPGDLDTIWHARRAWPDVDQVACFDTGFHHDLPEWSRRLPVPDELVTLGVRRYGFHGLSLQSVLHAHPDLGHAVIAHLGSGCSVSAVADGHSRHTTMSLTPTSGVISGTRTGDLDPEIALYLIQQHGYSVDGLRDIFDHRSGLAGLAGGRHDVRDLLAATDPAAQLALEVFVRDTAAAIAACATHLDHWDSLVFTGGVGEHATAVRDRICARLLAIRTGSAANPSESSAGMDALASTGLRVLVVTADEESVLDRLTRELLSTGG